MGFTLRDKICEHLCNEMRLCIQKSDNTADLDRIQGTTRTLRVELDAPDLHSGFFGGLDTFYRRIITVDEKRFPPLRERVLQRQSILMVLAGRELLINSHKSLSRLLYLVTYTLPALIEPAEAKASTGWLWPRLPKVMR